MAGPDAQAEYRFVAAGMTDPQIVVPTGARVALSLVNADADADADMAHGIAVVPLDAMGAWMPMMNSAEAFAGAAIWALGDCGPSGLPTASSVFTADHAGTYAYLCPVPLCPVPAATADRACTSR